ncbi:MAG: OmpA family protein [Spirochaetes bacterium]|nr:OmpA family protein [Spirochaetota bacterium]
MKKKLVIVIVFIYILSLSFSTPKIEFRLSADFYSNPYFYECIEKMHCRSLNGSIMLGVAINKFTIGLEVFENYYSLNSSGSDLKGAWNIIRGTIDLYYKPINWFELKWGFGGAWYRSSFNENSTGITVKNEGGLSIILNAAFFPPFQYIHPELINRLDLFFFKNYVTPYYYGAIKCVFHPFIKWINIYIEAGGMTWINNDMPYDIKTGMFIWSAGIYIDLSIMSSINKMKNDIRRIQYYKKEKNGIIPEKEIQTEREKKLILSKEEMYDFNLLKNGKVGDIIIFNSIKFSTDSSVIKEQSFIILDKIAELLNSDNNFEIEIRGHSGKLENLEEELLLSQERADKVREYLIKKGINKYTIIANGYGSLYTDKLTKEELDEYLEIKIIKKY